MKKLFARLEQEQKRPALRRSKHFTDNALLLLNDAMMWYYLHV